MRRDVKKCLVVGASGMLGRELSDFLETAGIEVIRADRSTTLAGTTLIDIANRSQCREVVASVQPDWVVNCAAYTAVDAAESAIHDAFKANAEGVLNVALAVRETSAALVHLSTDYVFGGAAGLAERRTPYSEEDQAAPCGIYGLSKFYGEQLLEQALPGRHIIARTSWLHGKHGPNFVRTIAKAAAEKPELRVVADQFGCPAWTGWVSECLLGLMRAEASGTYHVTCSGIVSWYDFARAIVSAVGLATPVIPITSEELDRPAPRPRYSALSTAKLSSQLGVDVMGWERGLACHLESLKT